MKNLFITILLVLFGFTNSWSQCPSTVTISGAYATLYTGSNTWISSSGSTTIPTGANVTLDANPVTNGYVLLDVGFETQPNSIFLAVVQTPCALLGINSNQIDASLRIYPNPMDAFLNINATATILNTEIVDINGRTIQTSAQNKNEVALNLENLQSGIYLLKVTTENGSSIQKIIKN